MHLSEKVEWMWWGKGKVSVASVKEDLKMLVCGSCLGQKEQKVL